MYDDVGAAEAALAGAWVFWSTAKKSRRRRRFSRLLFEVHSSGVGERSVAERAEQRDCAAQAEGDSEGVRAVEQPTGNDRRGGGDHEAGEVLQRS